jgi:hypothetical protein
MARAVVVVLVLTNQHNYYGDHKATPTPVANLAASAVVVQLELTLTLAVVVVVAEMVEFQRRQMAGAAAAVASLIFKTCDVCVRSVFCQEIFLSDAIIE